MSTTVMGRRRTSNFDLPPRMHRKGNMYYYVTSGKPRKWIPLHKELAKARILWAEHENGLAGDSFVGLMDWWMATPEFTALAKTTKAVYTSISKQLRLFFEEMSIQEIKPMHIYNWLDNYHSPHQANIGRAVISNVMEIAIRKGFIDRNPVKETKPITLNGRDRYMTDEEFVAIREKANDVLRCAMDISYITGCRISDVLKIQLSDCTEEGVLVLAQKTAKRKKVKQLFTWNPALKEAVENAKAIPRPVRGFALLCTRRGPQYSYATLNDWWSAAVKAAGVDGIMFRDIRAKAATDAKLMRMDYQALLGHSSKRMSERYIRIHEPKQVEALSKKPKGKP